MPHPGIQCPIAISWQGGKRHSGSTGACRRRTLYIRKRRKSIRRAAAAEIGRTSSGAGFHSRWILARRIRAGSYGPRVRKAGSGRRSHLEFGIPEGRPAGRRVARNAGRRTRRSRIFENPRRLAPARPEARRPHGVLRRRTPRLMARLQAARNRIEGSSLARRSCGPAPCVGIAAGKWSCG